MLLFDTHAWIWSIEGDARRVGRRTRHLLVRSEADDTIRVSPASIFEVAALHTSGRLRLSASTEHWIRSALAAPGVRLAELTPAIAVELDRFLVATARQLNAVFLTGDRTILDYASRTGAVRVHDVGA
jgi:PIN domain nuclease of toxin-antitoxin system